MESNFEKEIIESQQAFIKQFDPDSETFHGGDPTPVPVWTDKVPESMPTVYDKEYIQKATQSTEQFYGLEYERLTEMRNLLLELKKALNLVCPPLEAVLRIRSQKITEEKKEKLTKAEIAKLKKIIEEIEEKYLSIILKTAYAEKYAEGLQTVCRDAFKEFKDKEDYTNYLFFVKKYTAQCFSDSNEILTKLKQIKASHKPS